MNSAYNADFIKEAKKHQHRKEPMDTNRKELSFWLFSLSAFTENPILLCAKASGSEPILNAVNGLQEFSAKLLEKCLELHVITKNIAKMMKQLKLYETNKEESQSPSAKRARAQEALEKPTGVSLPLALAESRPGPVHLGGGHDHHHAAQMCLSVIGTQFEKAAQVVESSVTAILMTADEFMDALKATAINAGGSLNADLLEHQKAYEIFGNITLAYLTVMKPHKEHEYHTELGRFSDLNMEIQKKRQEFTDLLKAGGVGSPGTLFSEVETMRNSMTLEGSSSGPWRVQEHLFTPKTEQEVRNATKGLFNSFRSIDALSLIHI